MNKYIGSKLGCVTAVLATALAGASCSLVYDDDVFATADAFVPVDPTALEVTAAEPTELFEGMGASEESRSIPIVVYGKSIIDGARIRVVGAGVDVDEVAQVSVDGTIAAVEIRLPIDTAFVAGDTSEISITLSQPVDGGETGGTVEASTVVDALGLDEFHPVGGTVATGDLAARYSEIILDAPIAFLGDTPARLVATGRISVTAEVRADGGEGGAAGVRAAGGFLGGGPEQNGLGPGGGGRGAQGALNGAGAGGGGNLAQGIAGQGDSAGVGGSPANAEFLFPFSAVVGQGGGGGGNNKNGGSGGGAIEIRSSGPVVLGPGAQVSANGFDGDNSNTCALGGGGGGGGSGGAILVRSESKLTVAATASLAVDGGSGGTGSTCAGGAGSDGQIRVDYAEVDGSVSNALRRPSWTPESLPTIVRTSEISAKLVGDLGATYFTSVNAGAPTAVTMAQVAQDVSLSLEPGLNSVCALVASSGNLGQPESLTCASVAYLP
jgi:hypothetical protein